MSTLEGKNYVESKIGAQTEAINKYIVERMSKVCGNFKFIASTLICQNSEGKDVQLVSNVSAMWSVNTDSFVDITWQSEAMCCVVGLFGVLI